MTKEGTQADRPSILLTRRKEGRKIKGLSVWMARPSLARQEQEGLGWARGRGLPVRGE